MSENQATHIGLHFTTRGPNNTYTIIAGESLHDAFSEALEDLRTANFPSLGAVGTIDVGDYDSGGIRINFSLVDTVSTMVSRYHAEMDEIMRLYGDDA